MSLSAHRNCAKCGKGDIEHCSSILCPRPRTAAELAELKDWLERKAPLEDGCEIGAGTQAMSLSEEDRALIERVDAGLAEEIERIGYVYGSVYPRTFAALLFAAREEGRQQGSGRVGEPWPISTDGPHQITDQRAWLARQLMDSKNSDAEAFGIVAYHPAIRTALSQEPHHD